MSWLATRARGWPVDGWPVAWSTASGGASIGSSIGTLVGASLEGWHMGSFLRGLVGMACVVVIGLL